MSLRSPKRTPSKNVDPLVLFSSLASLLSRLCITEEEYCADFSLEVRFSGRISALISTRNATSVYSKYIEGDIGSIVAEALRAGSIPAAQFDVHEASQAVRTVLTGKCAFRYGIEQDVHVEQEKLPTESPPKYRSAFLSPTER